MTALLPRRGLAQILALIVILAVDRVVSPQFFDLRLQDGRLFGSMIDVLNRGTPVALLSLGMVLVIATRGIDLSVGAVMAALLAIITPLPLWALLTLLAVLALGLGTTFPVAVVSVQAAVARHLVGTVTGAMNFFRSLMAAVTVALFTAILLAALGGASSGMLEHPDLGATSRPEMIAAFRYVFIAAAVMLGTGALAIALMFERPLGDAPKPSVDMAE